MSDTFGVGQAAQAATTAATTAAQMAMAQKAMNRANETGKEVASNLTQAGTSANALLDPYADSGTNALNTLSNGLTESYLQNTPGYKWNLQQGEQAATNSAAARGLANSGAALKGASTFASGLADSTYQNQFNDTNTLANYGYNALNQQGTNTLNAANLSGQARMAGVGAAMAGTTAQANALQNGLNSLGNQAANYGSNYAAYNKLINGGTGKAD
ncbi:hypothetical protein [Acetobacter cerevisiae]|uniref:DNA transfer protein n=1 Tax=Acetobacter cerevisiae TaxID=178900 RepID=A0A149Q7W4_9PROT|nr:hypothetical protein [Acetobacter cerevisiae]KXU93307.1 hypothetical protein AD928_09025 [Acetobacter cerevisiae]GBQ10342.1 hypothetical protein AA14362_2521 [Acetobacter cerevisiae DSM 14362]